MGWWRRKPDPPASGSAGSGSDAPFRDRDEAGRILAARLGADALAPADAQRPLLGDATRVVVLGIPRGGVPVAAAVATALGAQLDVLVAHKVGAPGEPELAIGAVAADGSIRRETWASRYVSAAGFDAAADGEIARARARERDLRAGRPAVPLAGATVILVDDGVATGATMLVAIAAARGAGAARVIVAVPVAAHEAVTALAEDADAVVAAVVPHRLRAVGEWYLRFDQVDDAEVRRLLAQAV